MQNPNLDGHFASQLDMTLTPVNISLLSRFRQLAPFLFPKGFNAPTLRHPDLSLNNILLVPGSTEIASIIDWQDATVFPLLYPRFCEHNYTKTQSLETPSLPEDFDSISPEEQIQAKSQFRLDKAYLCYTAAAGVHNHDHAAVPRLLHRAMREYLFQR